MRIIVHATLKGDPSKRLELAIARGLNEGGDLVRTQVRRALKAQTNVKAYRSITSRTEQSGKGTNRAAPGRLVYGIYASRKAIPIKEFPVTVRKGAGGAVTAQSWGVAHVFKRSFQKIGGALVARTGKDRFPVRRLLGPNLAKELTVGQSAEAFHETAAAVVPPAVLKHLGKALQ